MTLFLWVTASSHCVFHQGLGGVDFLKFFCAEELRFWFVGGSDASIASMIVEITLSYFSGDEMSSGRLSTSSECNVRYSLKNVQSILETLILCEKKSCLTGGAFKVISIGWWSLPIRFGKTFHIAWLAMFEVVRVMSTADGRSPALVILVGEVSLSGMMSVLYRASRSSSPDLSLLPHPQTGE